MLTLSKDGKGVKLMGVRAVEHADGLTIIAVPVGNLAIRAGSQELRLVWVVHDLFEHGRFEEAHDTVGGNNVPNNARSVIRSGNSLGIGGVDANIRDTTTVLLKGGLHDLSLVADLPDTDLTLHTSRDDASAVVGGSKGSDSVVVSVIHGVQQTA